MRSVPRVLAMGLLLFACRSPREQPPEHLARLRTWLMNGGVWDYEEKGLLPWSNEADAIFREGSADGPPFGLGCEIVLRGYSENVLIKAGPESARADLSVRAWFGTDRGKYFLRVEGPDNQNELRLVFPFSGLTKGDPVVFDIHDRDAIGYAAIDRVEAVLDGPPPFRFTGMRKIAEVSCRSLVRDPFDRAFTAHEGKAKQRIAALRMRKPDPSVADLGWFGDAKKEARESVSELAPFAGWDDPRMKTVLSELRDAEVTSAAAFGTFVLDERGRVAREATLEDGLVLRARRVSGKPPEIELDVKNTTSRPIVLGAPFHGLEGFGVDSTRTQLFPDESTYDLRVAPGASVTLHYRAAVGAGYEAPKAAMLLRAHRREIVLPMDRPFTSPLTGALIGAGLECDPKKGCVVRLSTGGAPLADATRGLHIGLRVRGRPDGTEWKPGEWALREKDVAPEEVALAFERPEPRAELPWSVATDL